MMRLATERLPRRYAPLLEMIARIIVPERPDRPTRAR